MYSGVRSVGDSAHSLIRQQLVKLVLQVFLASLHRNTTYLSHFMCVIFEGFQKLCQIYLVAYFEMYCTHLLRSTVFDGSFDKSLLFIYLLISN